MDYSDRPEGQTGTPGGWRRIHSQSPINTARVDAIQWESEERNDVEERDEEEEDCLS